LYRNGLIMYDHQTESLWSHILGRAIAGDLKGTQLTLLPALQTDWGTWKALHPDTLVVSPDKFGRDPYASYYRSGAEGVVTRRGAFPFGEGGPLRDDDIPSKEYVIGVRLAGQARAYRFSLLNDHPVINDEIGGIAVAVLFDRATASGAVFDRTLADGTVLTFASGNEPRRVGDAETSSEWDILTGTAISGPLAGTQLAQVPATYAFWFGWVDYHPDTTVYTITE